MPKRKLDGIDGCGDVTTKPGTRLRGDGIALVTALLPALPTETEGNPMETAVVMLAYVPDAYTSFIECTFQG